MKNTLYFSTAILLLGINSQALAATYSNASQWSQIGWQPQYNITINNNTDQIIAPTGAGITVGVVDSGGTPQWIGYPAGQVTLGTCQLAGCVSSQDDNGHGTFVTSEIVSNIPSVGMIGLANGAKILDVKVLDASGSGNSSTVAGGIISAVNGGARVVNLSLGVDSAAFYSSIASAVNYAASKGAVIVFAGGNSGIDFVGGGNITGFSDAAVHRMLFAGSVNSTNAKSSFSNTAGTSGFTSTTGKFYSYSSLWMMANGEALWGASNFSTPQSGYSYVRQMSGTSMTAPQIAAAVVLLESQWPILRTNGIATKLLTATTTDLGATGFDPIFGSGLLNIAKAIRPYGTLTVFNASGTKVKLSSVTGSVILSGAFGALTNGMISPELRSILANYSTFDSIGRNYKVDLSKLVSAAQGGTASSSLITAPATTIQATKFADGSILSFGQTQDNFLDYSRPDDVKYSSKQWFTAFTDVQGTTIAAGFGFPASASFASALWGTGSEIPEQVYSLGASNILSNIAQGGVFFAYGEQLNKNSRYAFSFSQMKNDDAFYGISDSAPSASTFSAGYNHKISDDLSAGLTFGVMEQKNGLLNSRASGMLSLGKEHNSTSMGFTSTYKFDDKRSFVFDAGITRTDGANLSDGFISSVSATYARSLGASYVEQDTLQQGDSLNLSVKAPLKVISSSAKILVTDVDEYGLPVHNFREISLNPSGNEIALSLGYQAPANDNGLSWNLNLEGRNDAGNLKGEKEASAVIRGKLAF